MIEDYNIKSDVEIDRYHLEEECITISSTYRNYGEIASDARTLVTEKEDMLKVVRAERNIAIREQCAAEGKKVTEGIISSMVDCDSEVVKAMKELREAKATSDRLNVGVKSLEMKKAELDNLVKLRCNGNYVDNTVKPSYGTGNDDMSRFNRQSMTPLPSRG